MRRLVQMDAAQRVEIVLMMLRKDEPATALARRHGVSETTLYRCQEEFLAGGQQGNCFP